MSAPKVSVVMCVYNDAEYIREAVDGILSQTFRDFEFIIVNDGSIDGTLEILQSYKDDRIILLNNPKNLGIPISANKGLSASKGKYIARADGDDISLPERLEKQVHFLDENPNVGVISSSAIFIDKYGKNIGDIDLPTENNYIKSIIMIPNSKFYLNTASMYRHEFIEKVGKYREWVKYAEDIDLYLRISEKYEVGNVGEKLCKVRIVSGSISTGKVGEQTEYVRLVRIFSEQRQVYGCDDLDASIGKWIPMRKLNSKFYLGVSKQYHTEGMRWNPKLSAVYLFKSLINNPLNLESWNHAMQLSMNKVYNQFRKFHI